MNFPKNWFTVINNEKEHQQIFDICKKFLPETNLTITSIKSVVGHLSYSYPFVVTNTGLSRKRLGYIGWDCGSTAQQYAEVAEQIEFVSVEQIEIKKANNKKNIEKVIEDVLVNLTAQEKNIDKMIEDLTNMRDKLKTGMSELDASWNLIKNMKIGT